MILQGKSKVPVTTAVLHCAAIPTGAFSHMTAFQAFATVDRWHVERGWQGFGYHWLVMPDGELFAGRPPEKVGAHVARHNVGTLGILLIESRKIDRIGRFSDWFTAAQGMALRFHLQALQRQGVSSVRGHNDFANKLCPGFQVSEWL